MKSTILSSTLAAICAILLLAPAASATNIIVNGDFSAGNTGFTSSYGFSPGNCFPEGVYDIVTNPISCHFLWASFGDHTTGTGNMMAINGAATANVTVWSENLIVLPSTQYYFSTWVASVYPTSPARLNFSVNSSQLGSVFSASTTTGLWQLFYASWFSGANTTATLSIVNQNTAGIGNDFALDDLVFDTTAPTGGTGVGGTVGATVPEPSTWVLLGTGVLALALKRRRK